MFQVIDLFVQGFSAQSLIFMLTTLVVYGATLGVVFWDGIYMTSWFNRVYPDAEKETLKVYARREE